MGARVGGIKTLRPMLGHGIGHVSCHVSILAGEISQDSILNCTVRQYGLQLCPICSPHTKKARLSSVLLLLSHWTSSA